MANIDTLVVMKTGSKIALYRLVLSMNAAERAAFKKQHPTDTHHMMLFEWMAQSKEYTPENYQQKLKEVGAKRSYSNIKQYLRQMLEEFLIQKRLGQLTFYSAFSELAVAYLYIRIDLPTYALKIVRQVKEECYGTQHFAMLGNAIRLEIHINELLHGNDPAVFKLFDEWVRISKEQQALAQIANYDVRLNHFRLSKFQKEYAPEEWKELKAKVDAFANSFNAEEHFAWTKLVYYEMMGIYWGIEQNALESRNVASNSLAEFEQNEELLNTTIAAAWTFDGYLDYDTTRAFKEEMLPRIKALLPKVDTNQTLHHVAVLNLELREMNLLHSFDGLPETEERYASFENEVPSHFLAKTSYLLSISFKKMDDNDKAKHYLTKHLESAKQSQGGTQEAAGRVLELLYLIDEQNDDLLFHKLNNYKQFVRNQHVHTDLETMLIRYLQKWQKTNEPKTQLYQDLKTEILATNAPAHFAQLFSPTEFDLLHWLNAHIAGVGYGEYDITL